MKYNIHGKLFAYLGEHSAHMERASAALLMPASQAIKELERAIQEHKICATHYWVGYLDGLRTLTPLVFENPETEKFFNEYLQ